MAPPADRAGRGRLPRRRPRPARLRRERCAGGDRGLLGPAPGRRRDRRARRRRGAARDRRRARLGRAGGVAHRTAAAGSGARGADPVGAAWSRARSGRRPRRSPVASGRSTTCCTSRSRASPMPSWAPTPAPRCGACSRPPPAQAARPRRWRPTASSRRLAGAGANCRRGSPRRTWTPTRRSSPVGFTGGLNWYRNLDRNWELTAAWRGARVTPPARYLAGEHDLVVGGRSAEQLAAAMAGTVADLRGITLLPGCGHWTQQERPDEVNSALLEFAASLS